MTNKKINLLLLSEKLGICHFEEKSPVPDWALEKTSFTSITQTMDELSVVVPQYMIPGGVMAEKDWRAFKVQGDVELASIGVISSLSEPLAKAGISIFNVSTYQTNYVLVEEKNLVKAKEILSKFCEIIE